MAHSFKTTSGRNTFGTFKSKYRSSDYITNKKAQTIFCNSSICPKGLSYEQLLLFKKLKNLNNYDCNNVNSANLNINLITKLNLENVSVIKNNVTDTSPTTIDSTTTNPYLKYTIDPNGSLFGNTICGENNYVNYQEYNPYYIMPNPGHINNL
jgi:hypothetical protein